MTTPDEMHLITIALGRLAHRNPVWDKNFDVFVRMDRDRRLWWWGHVKKQAALGVPAMQELVTEVIKSRMKG